MVKVVTLLMCICIKFKYPIMRLVDKFELCPLYETARTLIINNVTKYEISRVN